MKGQKPFEDSMGFDGIHIVSHLAVDDDSLHSSDEELLTSPMVVGALQDVLYPLSPHNTHFLHGAESSGKESDGTTDSDPDDPASAAEANGEIIFAEALGKWGVMLPSQLHLESVDPLATLYWGVRDQLLLSLRPSEYHGSEVAWSATREQYGLLSALPFFSFATGS